MSSKNLVIIVSLVFLFWQGNTIAAQWANPGLLVNAETVNKHITDKSWVIVDCRDLKAYLKGHIPGAINFGKRCKKALRDSTSRVFRDSSKYERLFGKVGISNNSHVVYYYDGLKTITDATVGFWITEYLGHDKTHVLNGGLEAWRKAGYRLDNKPAVKDKAVFKVNLKHETYGSTEEILQIADSSSKAQLIDSRTSNEHKGKDIRAIRGGFVPNTTINASHITTLASKKNPKTGKPQTVAYFDADAAAKAFGGLDKTKRTLAYCQTGTRSTMTYFQMRLLGFKDPANWDESWRVYGSQLSYPVAGEQWFNFAGLNKKIKKLEKKVSKLEASKK